MNKTVLKEFAITARNKLMASVKDKAGKIGISADDITSPITTGEDFGVFPTHFGTETTLTGKELTQRDNLIGRIHDKGYDAVMEEVAYTWFNRLIAVRFMEVNDYLPTRIRVLSSETKDKLEPDMITKAPDIDLKLTEKEKDDVINLKMKNQMDSLFQMLFIKQCNTLGEILPELFENTSKDNKDYTEILLDLSYTNEDSVIRDLLKIEEEDFFDAVEIIGWLYQYYNTERKDAVFARPKSQKITKVDIPAVTQLFTPDWIVRYMVENSLGRLWIEKLIASGETRSEKEIAEDFGWKYYLPEAQQNDDVKDQLREIRNDRKDLKLEEIKFIDPAMGSFHIGVYAFDIFMQLYESQGYTRRDAAKLIIENNLYGIDIDERAYQLSYFACLMRGRQYNRGILKGEIKTNLYTITESNGINRNHLDYLGNNITNKKDWQKAKENIIEILDTFIDAKEYGSILQVEDKYDFETLKAFILNSKENTQVSLETVGIEGTQENILKIIDVAEVLSLKYEVVVTNPPYLGSSGMNAKLSNYVKKNYPNSKSDLFAVFMESANRMLNINGISALITMQSWMFLSSFEKLRAKIIRDNTIIQLMHMNNMVIRIAFGTSVIIFKKRLVPKYLGVYHMVKYEDLAEDDRPIVFPKKDNRYSVITQNNFEKIPGAPIAYWVSDNLIKAFEDAKPMNNLIEPRQGLATANNDRFLKLWYEVDINKINFTSGSIEDSIDSKAKWFPYNKGGSRRQWYGNYDYVVNWQNDGFEIRNFKNNVGKQRSVVRNPNFYFRESITWSLITSGDFSIRYRETGSIHDVAGMSAFTNNYKRLMYILGLMSTKIANYIFKMLNPTISLQIGDFNNFPVLFSDNEKILELVEENISIAKNDWDSYETSWNFIVHPLLNKNLHSEKVQNINSKLTLEQSYNNWKTFANNNFFQLKQNEEELNRIFIEIYGLEDELTPQVSDRDITITKIVDHKKEIDDDIKGNRYILSKEEVIKSFISYGVGCIFGRYSLDEEGLAYAGGDWDESKYKTIIPDADNIIPITDEEYFDDDMVAHIVDFVKVVYGVDTLEENLDFIAKALGNRGNTSREVIRNYFLNDFYKDHLKIYQKRPIYWLFDSGKQNGFKALIYMHRYDQDTVGRLRTDYLHKIQRKREDLHNHCNLILSSDAPASEKAIALKKKETLIKQLAETQSYDQAIAHIALKRIAINLDDGVKVNYAKFQNVEVANEGKKAVKVNLLGKL